MATGLAAVAVVVAILAVAGYSLISEKPTPPVAVRPDPQDQGMPDPDASPATVSVSPSKENKGVAEPKTPAKPKYKPKVQKTIDLTGMWVDDEGVNVQISQEDGEVVSQAYNPLTGLAVNAVWRVSGRQIAFNWMSNAGNQGHGEGTIAADGATVDYRFVDNVTGEQGYGRLSRVTQ